MRALAWLACAFAVVARAGQLMPEPMSGETERVFGIASTTAPAGAAKLRGTEFTPAMVLRAVGASPSPLSAEPPIAAKALRVGEARMLEPASQAKARTSLPWSHAGDGWTARILVRSPDAAALRVGLAIDAMPEAAELRVRSVATGRVEGPVGGAAMRRAARDGAIHWTPLTEGDEQLVELWLPGDARPEVRIAVHGVSHVTAPPAALAKAGAEACHEDVACVAPLNPALVRASRAVAKLVYTRAGATFVCTGTLLNDGAGSQVPYLLTAAHCLDSPAVAATLSTLWFFDATQCGGAVPGSWQQLSGGATLLYANEATDVALVRLADRAPAGAWFAGWDAAPIAPGTSMLALHHPRGELKKVAIGDVVGEAGDAYVAAAFRVGATEPGSSGSGLFTAAGNEYLLRGTLRGGSASCSSSGNLADPANRDYYTRLDRAAPALRAWLSGTPAPIEDFTGMWFDPREPGWGLSIVQSPTGKAFVTVYTYDDDGEPAWLVAPDVAWRTAVALDAALYRTRGSALAAPYDASRASVRKAGSLSIAFGRDTATLSLEADGRRTAKEITRLRY